MKLAPSYFKEMAGVPTPAEPPPKVKYPVQDEERCPKCGHDFALCNCYPSTEFED